MWINNYPEMIAESPEELLEEQKRLRGSPLESRVKMLRLLKSGRYCSRLSLADALGYSLEALQEEMKKGNIARLEECRLFLAERFGIHYEGVSGLSRLFKRHQTKLKTGRRRHRRASEQEQAAFKK